jgi:hypothetical protein
MNSTSPQLYFLNFSHATPIICFIFIFISGTPSSNRDIFANLVCYEMAHRKGVKTHSYSAQRSGSKKYAKSERRKRSKPKA